MSKNGTSYSCLKTISNIFAENFQSIYSSVNDSNNNELLVHNSNNSLFSNVVISISDITEAIISLDVKNSSGPDSIPPSFLINCADNLTYPLFLLFNQSLVSGVFPSLWKSSYLIPIFKNGDKSFIDSYRGIATLSTIPKLFEKLVTIKLTPAVEPLLNEQQHEFRKNRSTTTNLAVFASSILCDMECEMAGQLMLFILTLAKLLIELTTIF